MSSKHSRQGRDTRRTVAMYLTISFAVAFAAVVSAILVHTAETSPPKVQAYVPSVSAPVQTISQLGRLLAITPTSVTAEGADGVTRTYVVDGQTNAITDAGSRVGGTAESFTVNDEVAIVGVVRNGTAVATAVAHRDATGPDGPPMDFVTP